VQSLLVRKISALVACTSTYTAFHAPRVDACYLYAMCKELQVALRQHETHVNPYLAGDQHERNLLDAYMRSINSQLRMVVPDVSSSSDPSCDEIHLCTTIYAAELASEVSWMLRQDSGCMLNLRHSFHANSMMMQKISAVCHLVSSDLSRVSIGTRRRVHAMLLVLQIAITEHEKYVNQFLSNSRDEKPMYEARMEYLMHHPDVGIGAQGGHDFLTHARRTINKAEFGAMTALGIHDPYNSILGLTPTPTHNINYMGVHHHGWRD